MQYNSDDLVVSLFSHDVQRFAFSLVSLEYLNLVTWIACTMWRPATSGGNAGVDVSVGSLNYKESSEVNRV